VPNHPRAPVPATATLSLLPGMTPLARTKVRFLCLFPNIVFNPSFQCSFDFSFIVSLAFPILNMTGKSRILLTIIPQMTPSFLKRSSLREAILAASTLQSVAYQMPSLELSMDLLTF
jgi:hypothetical protein